MVSVGADIKNLTIFDGKMEVQVSGSTFQNQCKQSLSNRCSESGITAGQRLLYTLRFQSATPETRNRGAAYSQTCSSVQSKGNKMAADRKVVVGVAAIVEEPVELARDMLCVEISKAVQ
jgi:hypothetical protein